jgi:hypothetical protein
MSASMSMSMSVPTSMSKSVSVSMSMSMSLLMYEFSHTYFNGNIYCQKFQWTIFKVTYAANGQLFSAYNPKMEAKNNCKRLFRPIQQSKSKEVWKSCNFTPPHSLTGPVGQPFASRQGGQRFAYRGYTNSQWNRVSPVSIVSLQW